MELLDSHWKDIYKILCLAVFSEICQENKNSVNPLNSELTL